MSYQPSGTNCFIGGLSKSGDRDSTGCIWSCKFQCLTGCCRQASIMVYTWIFKIDCLSYFFASVKRPWPSQLTEGRIYWGLQFQRMSPWLGGEHGTRQIRYDTGTMAGNFPSDPQTWSKERGRELTGNSMSLETLRPTPHPPWFTAFKKVTSSNPSQTVPLARNKVFK